MTVEALNCPNCGAGVASNSSKCEFCKTRLKTMACLSCFGLMFVGGKFCGHCGAIAAPVDIGVSDARGECPHCHETLERLSIGDTAFSGCVKCDGIWVDVATFETICSDRESQSAVLVFLANRTIKPHQLTKINYVPCPDCGQLMNRNNFARASGVIVDICKQHGVWFDADELPSIVQFIQKGGMEIARQREKMEISDERNRLRDEQRKQAIQDRRLGVGDIWEKEETDGMRSFIRRLFD